MPFMRLCKYLSVRLFLIKQVVKRFGVDTLKDLSAIQHLGWILPPSFVKYKVTLVFRFVVTASDIAGDNLELMKQSVQ
jgi:spore coat polysaccharide biosynthesis protein SpsF (cytidylyltransferase family)